jgi:tRNA/tmRNA/rRNA uracil-C5-methylase (TrmA/RlmC/RlmD family)
VIGIEMVASACENAKINKELNGISNYKIICSKVEDCINEEVK